MTKVTSVKLVNTHPHYTFWTHGYGTFLIPLALIVLLRLESHVWSPHLLHGKSSGFLECPGARFMKPTLWMRLLMYSQVTSSLMACPLLSLCRSHSFRPELEGLISLVKNLFNFFYKVVYLITLAWQGLFLLFCVVSKKALLHFRTLFADLFNSRV